jgi:hypothetical protein
VLLAPAARAQADELLVGSVRDQDGAVVAGAPVVALDAAGQPIGSDRTAGDGTFALSLSRTPETIVVSPNDARAARVHVGGARPVIVTVTRWRAADLAPTPADVASLPSGSVGALASVAPYRIASARTISDRDLDRGLGVTEIEGLPFYRRSDGGDATALLPSHATGAFSLAAPIDALHYGDRALGGVVDARLFDRADDARATDRDLGGGGGSALAGFAAQSWDDDGERFVVASRASFNVAGATTQLVALGGTAPGARYAGFGANVNVATQRNDLVAQLVSTNDIGAFGVTDARGGVSGITVDLAGRGANALELAARAREERGAVDGTSYEHQDVALVLGTSRGRTVRVRATLALAYGHDTDETSGTLDGTALLPALTLDAPLGRNWDAHLGFTEATLGTPGTALARGRLGEASVRYADHRRLVGEVIAYAEGDDSPTASLRGIAASLGWEIAPRLSLRSWLVGDGTTLVTQTSPYVEQTTNRTVQRQLAWLTWDGPLRVDLLLRAGALEGALRVPLGSGLSLAVDSARTPLGARSLSIGLTFRNR